WGGGVFVSSPAYADGYVDGTGNNIYYGYKTDASYTEARFHIEVDYYDTLEHAQAGKDEGKDPLGKFVRVHYLSNCNKEGGAADDWRFRPMWWYGVPKGLQNVQNITYTRVEKMTNMRGNQPFVPAGSSQFTFTDTNGYGVASKKTYPTPKQWKSISNFYFDEQNVLASKGWKQLLGLNGGSYDNAGNTEGQWGDYKDQTAGLQGIFVDWESAGQRFYDMTYVGEMTDDAWQKRDVNPLRFAAGVYRFAGNWHYAVGQKHNTPKIADHLKLVYPEVTKVKKLDALSTDEKGKVQEAIEKANRGPAGSQTLFDELVKDGQDGIVVNDNGSATITFKDNTKRTMPASLLVSKDESDSDKYKPTLPDAIPVVNPSALTEEDKNTVIAAFKEKNKDNSDFNSHLAETDGIKFDDKGENLVVTYKDGSKATIPASELVFQGPKISDWAPYRVPVPTEVDDPSQALTQDQKNTIASAFDEANKSFPVYQAAKTHNNNTSPVTFDNKNNAVITWADGSQTTVPAWMFLKKRQTQATKPEQKQTTKEFTVDLPATPTEVTFDPFDKTATVDQNQLSNLETALKDLTAKDSSDSNKTVTLTSAKIDIANGTITFKAEGYEDRKYPIGIFYKKKVNGTGTQSPTQQTPTSKTDTDPDQAKNTFTYNVRKIETDGDKPTVQDAIKALKQFVKDNYNNVSDDDLATVADSVTVNTKWVPKAGTKNMGAYGAKAPNDGPMTSFSIDPTNGFAITVHGHPWDPDADNGADWNSSLERGLFTIQAKDLYVKKGTQQTPTDNTVEKLKELAKQLLNEKKNLTKSDFRRAGLNKDEITDNAIDKMNDAEELRDLIKKLSEVKHADRTYNSIGEVVVDDPTKLTEDDFKKAVKAFVKANYDKSDNFQANDVTTALPTDLTPKSGTIDMEIADDNIKSVTSSETDGKKDYKSIVFKDAKGTQLFTVAISYKKKEETPKLSDDELKEMRKQAKETIDHNPNLTKTDKDGFDKRIDEATTAEQIQNILKEAAEKANQNSTSTDPKIKGEISGNQNGTDAENKQKLDAAKEAAKKAIEALKNLSNEEKTEFKNKLNGTDIKTPADVQQIVDAAKLADELKGVKDGAQKEKFVFLDHGTGAKGNTEATHADDAALNELLGGTPAKDPTLTALEDKIKDGSTATADEIKNALNAAKRQNAINEENAKNAGIAKLDALLQKLEDAENGLNETQKEAVKQKVEAAKTAINGAKTSVKDAKKPSDIKTAVGGVKIDDALKEINTQVTNAQQNNKQQQENENKDALANEKKEQIARINNSNLPDADKKKAIDDIDKADKLGDPTGIADRALKAQKIKDALAAIDNLEHLNDAQKKAYKDIINTTDAGNHKDDQGKDTGVDDIDDALANAANTDNAMARLEELKKKANDFKNEKDGKYSKLTNSEDDQNKKKAFDSYLDDATKLTTPKDGDAKGAAEVNTLYNDLLKAMRDIDPQAKSAGLKTDALKAEIDSDNKLKPNDNADPKTPGDSVYTTASADKKDAFDKALNEAQTVLNGAKKADISTADKEATEQKEIDAALDKLIKARLALDGVNTKPLQDEINKDSNVKDSDKYKYATTTEKKTAFDKALQAAQDLIDKLTGTKKAAQGEEDVTTKTQAEKQKLVDDALAKLKAAEEALDGKAPVPVPPSGDENPGSGSESDSGTGSGSDSGSGDSTSTSGGVNKQNLINQINTTENPGGANPGSGAAGANPSTPGAGAQGAGMGAVTPGSGAGAAGTGAAGAASAGVDNKAVNNAVESAPEVKQADAAVKQAAATLDEALAQAKRVAADPHATQAQVDAAA
ncbi:hypothetical protein HMPREF1586_01000, partial [Gardnerella vaginalis JCP8522]